MSFGVEDLLERGRAATPEVSALDAVMGKDWAIVDAGRPRKARQVHFGLRTAHASDVKRGLSGGLLPGRKPQAVVKMIRNGGASDARGLRAQMAYLSREGTQPMQRSEALMGVEVDAEQAAAIEKAWRMPPDGSGRADRTSHFIVSFPEDADHGAAERAGRAWAEEMFGSGEYGGDSYDYYTAFHTDRAHPHTHVVVYRRGLEHGEWLKVSQRGDMNYDRMREVLVDVAGREGIELEATTRLARGLHDRPVPDAEYRLAAAERREAEAPEHTRETAIRAAASLIHFARQFAADARALERDLPEQAKMLHSISERLAEGRAITTRDYGELSSEGEKQMADRLREVTEEVRGKFKRLDGDVLDVDDNATRMRLLRQIAELKANTAPYMRDPGELRPFTERDDSGRFDAFPASDPVSVEVKTAADQVARNVAEDYGVDPDATVERYSGVVPSKGLARQFVEAEERERGEARALSGEGPESVEDRRAALAQMRVELQNVYREGRDIADERHAEMAERLQDRGFDEREAERMAREGGSEDQRQHDLEKLNEAKNRPLEIVDSTPWRNVDDRREEVQDVAVRSERGFHPGYSYAPDPDSEEVTTRYSSVVVATPEEALRLADVFREGGDRGVRAMTDLQDRQAQADRSASEAPRTAEQDRILRELDRDTADHDR